MTTMRRWISAVALAFAPLAADAAVELRPGLWSLSVQMAQYLALDPELVEQMRQMGLQIPQRAAAPPNVYDLCITPEQARAERLPDIHDTQTGCTGRNLVRSGDRARGDLQCNGMLRGTGKVELALTGPQGFTGDATFRGASQEGLPLDLRGKVDGVWRAAECGNVQPVQ
jgi:hypothetical protein